MADESKSKPKPELRRRSQRVTAIIPVVARVQMADQRIVSERSDALVVNAHGGLILLATEVPVGKFIMLENPKTGHELLCRVTIVGAKFMGKAEIGLEFIKPTPEFWGIESPPQDWKINQPAKRQPAKHQASAPANAKHEPPKPFAAKQQPANSPAPKPAQPAPLSAKAEAAKTVSAKTVSAKTDVSKTDTAKKIEPPAPASKQASANREAAKQDVAKHESPKRPVSGLAALKQTVPQ
jgi:hypothetical protein